MNRTTNIASLVWWTCSPTCSSVYPQDGTNSERRDEIQKEVNAYASSAPAPGFMQPPRGAEPPAISSLRQRRNQRVMVLKICPDCGTGNHDLSGFCFRCSAVLPCIPDASSAPVGSEPCTQPHAQVKPEQEMRFAPDAQVCDMEPLIMRTEGLLSDINDQVLAHRCGLAAALSALRPGLGQIYAKEVGKGIAMAITWAVSGFLFASWCMHSIMRASKRGEFGLDPSHFFVSLAMIAFWIYVVVDAAKALERM